MVQKSMIYGWGLIGMIAGESYAMGTKSTSLSSKSNAEIQLHELKGAHSKSEKLQARWVWISVPSSHLQCDPKPNSKELSSLEKNRAKLLKANITVIKAQTQNDGQLKAAMCGMSNGEQDTFQILAQDLDKAKALGFSLLP
jgi:hypothetical protein